MTFPATHPSLARTLAARDYTVPTAVQLAVIEASANSGDLLVSAQTGSGKTVAFGLAIATTILGDAEKFGDRERERAALTLQRPHGGIGHTLHGGQYQGGHARPKQDDETRPFREIGRVRSRGNRGLPSPRIML